MNPWISAACIIIGMSIAYHQVSDEPITVSINGQTVYCEPDDQHTTSIIRRAEDGTLRCEKHRIATAAEQEARLKTTWPQIVAEWKGKK